MSAVAVDADLPTSPFNPPQAVLGWAAGDAPSATLHSLRVAGARNLANDAYVDAVAATYHSLWRAVQRSGRPHLVRLWNGVGGIHDRVDGDAVTGRDRYMLFNAGRHEAMRDWYGEVDLAMVAPAATGVGIDGDDFVVHALSIASPGESIQNPRQTPAGHYSRRYGPRPPCFARATRITVADQPTLLVSGTAAILGEDSMYADDLNHQLGLTIENLATVVRSAGGDAPSVAPLAAYTSLRAYLPRRSNHAAIEPLLRGVTRADCAIEFVAAQLCRRELLVEIEGVADLSAA